MQALVENNSVDTIFPLLKNGRSGILFANNYESISKEYAPEVIFALEIAKAKFNADAVYFRCFPNERAVIPQLYMFDYSQKTLTQKGKDEIHRQMWNGYQVPAYGIIEKTSVSIFDARETPKNKKEMYAREIIILTAKTAANTIQSFADGLFWEENPNHFKFEESAARDLIYGLKKVYIDFQRKSGIDSHIALKLLVQSLLIKYLEERDEKSKSGYFAGTYFEKNFQCNNFCDTIRNGKLLNLLDKLSQDFNGKVFEWDKMTEQKARAVIQKAEIKQLAYYLDGDIKDNQYVLWRLYSFEHLPVEVISSVYEELLTNSKDIVYTPEMIVSTLIDECMPLNDPQSDFKIIDVSCGSGIFLVKAYKRMIQWWRYEQWQKTGKLPKPSLDILKDILLKNIHGIDIQQDAVHLAVFSLALAVLDEVDLNPPTWEQLQFPDLSNNIVTRDFFKYITEKPDNDFSLVIGNPPFNLPQDERGKEPDREQYFNGLINEIGYQTEINIPDENPALHFLVQSMKLLKQDAMLCLIMPAGPLLYQKRLSFKQYIFSKYNLLQIIDFTKLSDKLWGIKKVATAALFLQNSKPDNDLVLHLVANRTVSNKNRLFLEFDHYDFHWITKEYVLSKPYIWKANLLGGGRIVRLLDKLSALPTLGDFLKKKIKEEQWIVGDGFIKGKPDKLLTPSDFEKKKGRYQPAAFLTGSLCFDPDNFDESGIIHTYIIKDHYFQWPRIPELFQAPLLMIKKNIGKGSIPVIISKNDISFKNEVIGIHVPENDIGSLENIEKVLKNNHLMRFYLTATSSRSGISRSLSTLLQQDVLNLPFYGVESKVFLSKAEDIIIKDVIDYYLSNNENQLLQPASLNEIKTFSFLFCQTLNSIYQTKEKSFQLYKILDSGKYYTLYFDYTSENIQTVEEKENTDDLEQCINTIIPTWKDNHKHAYIQRIVKIFGNDCVLLVKPKQLRYWLPSIALRDADEVFADYIKTRYPNVEK